LSFYGTNDTFSIRRLVYGPGVLGKDNVEFKFLLLLHLLFNSFLIARR
jgi:hypothetical protein